MEIALTTPTGRVGSRVLELLLQAGVRPRVLLRDADRLHPQVRRRCVVHELDQRDESAVVAATAGVDVLHWVCPPTGEDDPTAGYARTGRAAAAAVRAHGIGHVVLQSSVGAEARGGLGEIDGLAEAEQLLDGTGASVVHLRCGYFFTNLLTDPDGLAAGTLSTTLPLDQAIPWVDPRDVGDVTAARLLAAGSWSGRQVQAVHGPADLSFSAAAAVLSEVLGRPVRAVRVGDDDVAAGLRAAGMSEAQVQGVVGMMRGTRDLTPEQPRDLLTTTPTTLGSWAWEHLRAA